MNYKIENRINFLINKYTGTEIQISRLLCDDYEDTKLAFRIIEQDETYTDLSYGELKKESQELASGLLEDGIKPGDRIATLMGKSREFIITLIAIWRVGAVHVPLFTAFSTPAIKLRLNGSKAKIIFCDLVQQPKLEELSQKSTNSLKRIITTAARNMTPNWASPWSNYLIKEKEGIYPTVNSDAPLIHIFTSGTTGDPKGLVLPIKALATLQAYAEFGLNLQPDDVFWNAADPGWAYGLFCGIISSLTTGTPSIILAGAFNPELTLSIIESQKVTNFAAAPTVYRAIKSVGKIPSIKQSLRCASSAGEPLTPDVNDWAFDVFGVPVHDHYGQTEASMIINNSHNRLLRKELRTGSMGLAMPGWSVTVLKISEDKPCEPGEIGRIAVKLSESPFAWFKGYIGNKEKSDEKFTSNKEYYLTGDTGRIDKDGYFYFLTRDDDIIIMAGYRIGPFEVEAALSTHDAVIECAVIAAPDEVRGEVIEAYVVLRSNQPESEKLTQSLQSWVKKKFAAHAYPRRIHYVSELPKNPSGKVQRFLLRDQRRAEIENEENLTNSIQ